jgi:hypothetical protein
VPSQFGINKFQQNVVVFSEADEMRATKWQLCDYMEKRFFFFEKN